MLHLVNKFGLSLDNFIVSDEIDFYLFLQNTVFPLLNAAALI